MKCEEIKTQIQEFLDGELGAAEAEQVSRHLKSCESCRSEADAMRRVISAVAGLPGVSAPDGFLESVLARREEEAGGKPADNIVPIQKRPLTTRIIGLAATVIVAIILVLVLVRTSRNGTEVAMTEPESAVDASQAKSENEPADGPAPESGDLARSLKAGKKPPAGKAFFEKKDAPELLAARDRSAATQKKTRTAFGATPKHTEQGDAGELRKQAGEYGYAQRESEERQTVSEGAGRSGRGMRPADGRGYVAARERSKKVLKEESDSDPGRARPENKNDLARGEKWGAPEENAGAERPGDSDALDEKPAEYAKAKVDPKAAKLKEIDEAKKNLSRRRREDKKKKGHGPPSAEPEAPSEPLVGLGEKAEEQGQPRDRTAGKETGWKSRGTPDLKDDVDKLAGKKKDEGKISPPAPGRRSSSRPAPGDVAKAKRETGRTKAKERGGQYAEADKAVSGELIKGSKDQFVFRGAEISKVRSLLKKLEKDFPNLVMVTEKERFKKEPEEDLTEKEEFAGAGPAGKGKSRGVASGGRAGAPKEKKKEKEKTEGPEDPSDSEEEERETAGETLALEVDSAFFAKLVAKLKAVRSAKSNRAERASKPGAAKRKPARKPASPVSGEPADETEEKVLVIVIRTRPEAAIKADKAVDRTNKKTPTKSK